MQDIRRDCPRSLDSTGNNKLNNIPIIAIIINNSTNVNAILYRSSLPKNSIFPPTSVSTRLPSPNSQERLPYKPTRSKKVLNRNRKDDHKVGNIEIEVKNRMQKMQTANGKDHSYTANHVEPQKNRPPRTPSPFPQLPNITHAMVQTTDRNFLKSMHANSATNAFVPPQHNL